ncbi:MAG: dockerin type I repeat-containing protein [Clostridia bacterium]|nr:dockerin type I repeat-containing protein [Clostridia bacterium]
MKKSLKRFFPLVFALTLLFCLAFSSFALQASPKPGDINGDGVVDNRDAIYMIQFTDNLTLVNDTNEVVLDTNGSGAVSIDDLHLLIDYLSGKDVTIVADKDAGWSEWC